MTVNKQSANQIDGKVQDIAGQLGIRDVLAKYPYQVSGGQKQRCACVRAIINQPQLILADEPTGALDSNSSRNLLETMQDMNRSMGATILMVTHDAVSASYASRILFLKDGQIYKELLKGEHDNRHFFNQILDIMAELGGVQDDVR